MSCRDSFIDNPNACSWPIHEGSWWFFGYRYGKTSIGDPCEKELMLCSVIKSSDSLVVISDGQFMMGDEVEEPLFIPATLPELPV